jgi:general stress protein YciG
MTEKKLRGFALLTPEQRKLISSKGGKSVPAEKRTYANKDRARDAGRKGGIARIAKIRMKAAVTHEN